MKVISFFFFKFKLTCVILAFSALIGQQMNLTTAFSNITGMSEACNYEASNIESEEKIEDTESISEYLILYHFFGENSFQNFNPFHTRHFQYYYLIKQFTFEVIVPPPNFLNSNI